MPLSWFCLPITLLVVCACNTPGGQTKPVRVAAPTPRLPVATPALLAIDRPEAVVKDLYAARQDRETPFFQTKSRPLVDEFFTKKLADLIWDNAQTIARTGETGQLDFDPLYAAQDLDLLNLTIKPARKAGKRAEVTVSFLNFGKPHQFTYLLDKQAAGWRISDVLYDDGSQLVLLLGGQTNQTP